MSKLKITVLSDKNAHSPLISEHGLSLWIEYAGKNILFDVGNGDALIRNAELLGIDLSMVDIVIISHGHYDHTGNLLQILSASKDVYIYAHPHCIVPRYSIHENVKSIAMPLSAKTGLINTPGKRIKWTTEDSKIFDEMYITGEILRTNNFEDTGGPFFLDQLGEISDNIIDDLAIWFETEKGLVVVTGCAHAGIVNTIDFILSKSTSKKIYAIIGGFHLVNSEQDRVLKTIEYLENKSPEIIVPLHCTGDMAEKLLSEAFKEQFTCCFVGESINV